MEHSPRDVTEAIFAKDKASQLLGMTVVEVSEGHAVVTMTIGPEMLNGLGVCHGGFIFSLADSAMAFSSNASNRYALATNAEIDWVRPGQLGSTLTATATERHHKGRNGITDVVVTDENGEAIALFRGRTRQVDGKHL